MSLGVLVYIDNKKEFIEEFNWIYKSMIFSNIFARGDLIAVCHPGIVSLLPRDEKIKIIPSLPYADQHAEWNGYGYINSVANLCEPAILEACRNYEFILKTDCDTFLTPRMADFKPTGLCFGFGAYAYEDEVRRKLSECSARWGFPHSGVHNIGASVLGPTEFVVNFLLAQLDYCQKLLDEEFRNYQGVWPGWCKNVLTMYAGELALRRTYPQRCSLGLLDNFPYADRPLGSDILHIHAWHTEQYWSKHQFRTGKYDQMAPANIDRNTPGGYCHWLAVSSVQDVRSAMSGK